MLFTYCITYFAYCNVLHIVWHITLHITLHIFLCIFCTLCRFFNILFYIFRILFSFGRLRGTVALELAPGRGGPLDNSEADRRRPTRAVQVDSDSTPQSDATDFRHDRPTRTPIDSGLHRLATLVGPCSAVSQMERQFPARNKGGGPGQYCLQLDSDNTAGN
jgi:hypothetical protein